MPATSRTAEVRGTGTPLRSDVSSLLRTLTAGLVGGALCGVFVVGVLGRLVMRVLAVTSSEHVQGVVTDDDQVVGVISLEGTLSLAAFGILAGATGGLVYLLVRQVLPESGRARRWLFALLAGTVGGGLFVQDYTSFDFSLLDPSWFAVSAFVALPALFGFLVAVVVDRLDHSAIWARQLPLWLICLSALAATLAQPVVLLMAAVGFATALTIRTNNWAHQIWASKAVTRTGELLFAVLVSWGLVSLAHDVTSIVTQQAVTWPFPVL